MGLSQNNCPCVGEARPENYNVSKSGLFMDDYEHGLSYIFPKSAVDCGDQNLWSVLAKARYQGVMDATTYLLKSIAENQNRFVNGFADEFGQVNSRAGNTSDRSCSSNITGFTIVPQVYKGADLKIKKIWLAVDKAGTYTVNVYDLQNTSTPVRTVSIVHPGNNQQVGATLPGSPLPLSEAGRPIHYAIAYDRNGAYPLNYTYTCGCGADKNPAWMRDNYFQSRGFCVSAMEHVRHGGHSCNRDYTGGMIVEFELMCDPYSWLCGLQDTFWTINPWGKIFAKFVQIICTNKAIASILDTGRVNFYTLISAESLIEKKAALTELADELMMYLAVNMPDDVSDCWSCKGSYGFAKRGIIV